MYAGSLSPFTLALLETLQRLALCAGEIDALGVVQNRCDAIVESLAASSTKILLLIIGILLAVMLILKQYHTVHSIRSSRLPLDEPNYPMSTGPMWLKD